MPPQVLVRTIPDTVDEQEELSESSFKRIWRKYVPHIYSHQANDGLMLDVQEEQHCNFKECWV